MKATSDEVIAVSGASAVLAASGGTIIGLILAFAGTDDVIEIHGLIFAAACIGAGIYVMSNPRPGGPDEQKGYMDGPIKLATLAAVFWGVVGFLVGDRHRLAARVSRPSTSIFPGPTSAACGRCIPRPSSSPSAATF